MDNLWMMTMHFNLSLSSPKHCRQLIKPQHATACSSSIPSTTRLSQCHSMRQPPSAYPEFQASFPPIHKSKYELHCLASQRSCQNTPQPYPGYTSFLSSCSLGVHETMHIDTEVGGVLGLILLELVITKKSIAIGDSMEQPASSSGMSITFPAGPVIFTSSPP